MKKEREAGVVRSIGGRPVGKYSLSSI